MLPEKIWLWSAQGVGLDGGKRHWREAGGVEGMFMVAEDIRRHRAGMLGGKPPRRRRHPFRTTGVGQLVEFTTVSSGCVVSPRGADLRRRPRDPFRPARDGE